MKRKLLMAVVAMMSMTAWAQNIAVVSPNNTTTICQTLDEAISKATSGSVIYLPGGGFQIKDESKIDKKVTIMGVSHRGDTDNADGATVISGNLNFDKGSSGSAVLGVYLSGNINVGTATDSVLNLTVKSCNVNSIQVNNGASSGMRINQCYLRSISRFGKCNVHIDYSIVHSLFHIRGGTINHNIITSRGYEHGVGPSDRYGSYYCAYHLGDVYNSSITNNFLLFTPDTYQNIFDGGECQISNNCSGTESWGNVPVVLEGETTWDDVFYANKGVSIYSDYRLKSSWGKGKATDGTDIGINVGTGFDSKSLAPIPRIVSKKVDEQTDGTGRLKVEVTVKAQ